MSRLRQGLYAILAIVSVVSILVFTTVKAQNEATEATVVERHVIVTPVPTAKETVVMPTGYVNCFTIAAGWVHDRWVPEHKVCQYENMAEGVAWIEGYWACTKATDDGTCTGWEWKPAHWEKTLDVY